MEDLAILDDEEPVLSFDYLSDEDGPPFIEEIEESLKKLKNYKSVGVDEIAHEQLKYGAPGVLPWLRDLFAVIWEKEDIPSDWKKGIITIIPRKDILLSATTTEVLRFGLPYQSCS
jgi:hypothetical protein